VCAAARPAAAAGRVEVEVGPAGGRRAGRRGLGGSGGRRAGRLAAGGPQVDRVYRGAPTALAPVAVINGRGDQGIGRASAAGDVVGSDGIMDLIVGAPNTYSHDRIQAGAILLYEGPLVGELDAHSPLGQRTAVSQEVYGLLPGSQAGEQVWGLGDVDGDGIDDFAGLTPGHNRWGSDAGAVHIYLGRSVILDPWVNGDWGYMSILGHEEQRLVEVQMMPADLDGDGVHDIAISRTSGETSALLAWYGPLQPGTVFPQEADLVVLSHGTENLIHKLTATDLDQDGRDEVLLGMSNWGQAQYREAGAIWLLESDL